MQIQIFKGGREEFRNLLKTRFSRGSAEERELEEKVQSIVQRVRREGDRALLEYTEAFDGIRLQPEELLVTKEEAEEAFRETDPELIRIMKKAAENIRSFHEKQKRQSFLDAEKSGILLGQRITPLRRAGVYTPGGKAAYPSSVMMNLIPASVAGVKELIMVTPPIKGTKKIPPVTLVAASLAGVDKIYKIGGAQAVAALAYGTETIPRVDKIAGPGNIFVALAKKAVYGEVSIDSIAGPSEILVLADDTGRADFIARDLMSQAEHDERASAVLITNSERLAGEVQSLLEELVPSMPRHEILSASFRNHGAIVLTSSMEEAIEYANELAPEHLEIHTEDPFETMTEIQNAGAIFLGPYSSEPLGDYFAGPNHVLPTNGTARFFSPLGVDDFIKKSSLIYYSKKALREVHKDIEAFAHAEGLTAHEASIAIRFEGEEE